MLHYEISVYVITGDHPSFEPPRDLAKLDFHHSCDEEVANRLLDLFEEKGFNDFMKDYKAHEYCLTCRSWSTWMEDLVLLSVDFPKLLFMVHLLNDDDSFNRSITYFNYGKIQSTVAEIVYEPFDFGKMELVCKVEDDPNSEEELVVEMCPSISNIFDQLISMGAISTEKAADWKEVIVAEIKEYGELKATEG